jgi:FKBP-type peptidyl-prolyl cis-trans isomerase FkpA
LLDDVLDANQYPHEIIFTFPCSFLNALVSALPYNSSRSMQITRGKIMKNALKLIASLLVVTGIAACGGSGYSSDSSSIDSSGSSSVTVLLKTDTVVGTGATATAGKAVSVNYTGWLYSANAASNHGAQFDSSASHGAAFNFVLGAGQVIAGWDQGVAGMQVGGKRTLIIPSSLAYGATGNGTIPPYAALVFDIELLSVN